MKLQKCFPSGDFIARLTFSVFCGKYILLRSLHQNLPVILSEYCLEIQIKYAIKTKEPEEKGQKHIFSISFMIIKPVHEFLKLVTHF